MASIRRFVFHFSVIIPDLNSPSVDQTLRSLEQQTYDRAGFEVLVVGLDAPGLVEARPGVRFIPTGRPVYPGAARNLGAAQAGGEVLAFLDADCLAAPGWLACLAERFADPAVEIVGGGVSFVAGSYWSLADHLSMFHEYLASLPPGRRSQLPSLNLAIRRPLFLASGGFAEHRRTGEDSDLTIRLTRQGHMLHFEPRATITHCPARDRLADLLAHHFMHGKFSIKMDPRYRGAGGLPWPFRTRWGVLLGAPLLAAAVTARIYASDRTLGRYGYAAPAILLAKLAWCLGAAFHPRPALDLS